MVTVGNIADRVAALRLNIAFILACRSGIGALAGGFVAVGLWLLIAAAVGEGLWQYRFHAFLLPPVLGVVWAGVALRQLPGRGSLTALLERTNNAGGLIVASSEVDISQWADAFAAARPRVVWRMGRRLVGLVASAAFMIACMAAPPNLVPPAGMNNLQIDHHVDVIEGRTRLLEERKIIPQRQASQIRKELSNISKRADAADPAKTWESLDHVKDQLSGLARRWAQDAAVAKSAAAGALEAAGNIALAQGDPAATAKAMSELSEHLAECIAQSELLLSDLAAGQIADLLKNAQLGKLSPEQIAALKEALACEMAYIDERLIELADKCMIDPQQAAQLLACGQCLGSGVSSGQEGSGGIGRGGGPTPMTWAGESDSAGVEWQPVAITPQELSPGTSMVTGISAGKPGDEQPLVQAGGSLDTSGGAGSAYTHQILPRHRRAVEAFFGPGQ
jgi:hypothetical protein